MKIKKVLPLVLSLFMVGGTFAGLAGCNNGGKGTAHTHKYENWTSDGATTHTGTCTASGDCDAKTKTEDHVYDNETDTTCNKCTYVREIGGGTSSTPLPAGKKIYVVGDSTVCSFNDGYYLPRYGYGTQLAEYLNVTSDQIVNLALSGRSSKSFTYGLDVDPLNKNSISGDKSCYEYLTTNISAGDYLIIGFGHNDEKSTEPARFTDPKGTVTEENTAKGTSFKYCLYENYIKVAEEKGATPILCTPIVRYDKSGSYTGDKAHNTSNGDYSAAIRELGEEKGTTVIDLTELTKAVYMQDNNEAQYFHAHTTRKGDPGASTGTEEPDARDDTHINKYGAKMVAYQFANALKATDSTLKAHVKDGITAPSKAADYADAINKSYVKPDYEVFDPENTEAKKLNDDGWYATAMGALGGDSVTPFEISYASGKYTVGNETGNKGKIASNGDGFAAAFMQIDVSKDFEASATVTLKSHTPSNGQAAFGMMLRDDILVDRRDDTLTSNYVAAGALSSTDGVIFRRIGGTLSKSGQSSDFSFSTTATYTVSIKRTGQTVELKFGDGTTTYEDTYTDLDFVARDHDYMYLCLFATRSTLAEFTNVQFTITGDAQAA